MELVITTVTMAVVLIIAPVTIVKRAVKPKRTATTSSESAMVLCKDKCIYSAKDSVLKTNDDSKAIYDSNRHSDKPYEITLIGGGGGGTPKSKGCVGEEKTIRLFSLYANNSDIGVLTGYYLLEAGEGGEKEKSGKPSRICAITEAMAKKYPSNISCENKNATIIAQAMGGITSMEANGCGEEQSASGIQNGTVEKKIGEGGKINQPGEKGAVKIE